MVRVLQHTCMRTHAQCCRDEAWSQYEEKGHKKHEKWVYPE